MRRQRAMILCPSRSHANADKAIARPVTPVRKSVPTLPSRPKAVLTDHQSRLPQDFSTARRFSPSEARGSRRTSPSLRSCCSANLETQHRSLAPPSNDAVPPPMSLLAITCPRCLHTGFVGAERLPGILRCSDCDFARMVRQGNRAIRSRRAAAINLADNRRKKLQENSGAA